METTQTQTPVFELTSGAADKVRAMMAQDPAATPEGALRLEVQPGGCAGFKYGLFFDDQIAEVDIVAESNGVRVVVDKMSAPYVRGVKVDWVESLQQSGFVIDNPNAQGRCACGDSFQ